MGGGVDEWWRVRVYVSWVSGSRKEKGKCGVVR